MPNHGLGTRHYRACPRFAQLIFTYMNPAKRLKSLVLDNVVRGRVIPNIYAFSTNTIPNYLKVGDTYRAVAVRLEEWRKFFPELQEQFASPALVHEDTYFRDYAIHKYLEKEIGKYRLQRSDIAREITYSNEFFKDVSLEELRAAIADIQADYANRTGKYNYYSVDERLLKGYHYKRGPSWTLSPNQAQAVENFRLALAKGRTNLLMYAVMRFGKSFTSLCCALSMNAKLVVVVSAKADVRDEWKKTVETAGNFENFVFLDSTNLVAEKHCIKNHLDFGETVVVFLTLQDLQGPYIKTKHQELFGQQIDLLIIDETHFGARARQYGAVLQEAGYDIRDLKQQQALEPEISLGEASSLLKELRTTVRLHLSGTPYRILMGNEFAKDDIIAFVQFTDIVAEQEQWDVQNLYRDDVEEWDNPYYGFPQMLRFAFRPSKNALKKLEELQASGISVAFSKLFAPCAIKRDPKLFAHRKFQFEAEVLELLLAIDGVQEDENVFGFLDYEKIQKGQMCRHMVMVLPYCASCDAMETLLEQNRQLFKNLGDYEILNISGLDGAKQFRTPQEIKAKIKECEAANHKTLTLTVNRMLTGSTVEEWDTMIFLKDTASPQEYDQAIFRLQNQYIRTLSSGENLIKENLKPQTLLVDFDPLRLFRMQEQKSLIYNVNVEDSGNTHLRERIDQELRISPVIVMNKDRLELVEAVNILEAISEYNQQRSVFEEVAEIPVDLAILRDAQLHKVISSQSEFNSKQGLTVVVSDTEGSELNIPEVITESDKTTEEDSRTDTHLTTPSFEDTATKVLENKIRTYYQRLLFFAFLVKEPVASLDDIVRALQKETNQRVARNLGLDVQVISRLIQVMDRFKRNRLDYKIQNISLLAHDATLTPLQRAINSLNKFNRMSESEIITPAPVADAIVALIPQESLNEFVHNGVAFLDIASKSAEFTVSLYKLLTEKLQFTHEQVKDLIYAIPTSSIAYEFTRKFYEILGLNVEKIAQKFNSYDLVEFIKENHNSYELVGNVLRSSCQYKELKLELSNLKSGVELMKFGAVIGNPPYQVSDGGAQASAKPLYHHFVLLGKELTTKHTSFIIPSRWYAGGKGLDEFRERMLTDNSLSELHDCLTPEDVFPQTNNRGGVCYFITDKDKEDSAVRVVTHVNHQITADLQRELLIKGMDIFIRDGIALSIVQRVLDTDFISLASLVSPRKPFGIEAQASKGSDFSPEPHQLSNPLPCIAKGKVQGFIPAQLVKAHPEWIERWKVLVPRANNIGTELNDDNLNSFVVSPGTVCTESYIVVGADLSLSETQAQALSTYLQTKFVRFLHKQAKVSQDATSKTYRFIPVQDFSEQSDLDWTAEVDEVDQQLFAKYQLTPEQIHYIQSTIKPMK